MRADRLLSILLLLQARGQITARELARRLEVSERTIHRDMESLSAAGVPVYARRGAGGGWVLPEEYRTEPTGLNDAEVRALFLEPPARLLADLGLNRAAEAGAIKLLAALPATHRRAAEHVRQRIHVDVSGWRRQDEAAPLLPALQAAVLDDRRCRIIYGRDEASAAERTIDPHGLVAKGSIWYLIAAVDGDLRTYRVSRIRRLEVLDEPSSRLPDFDLAAFWEESKAGFVERLPRYPVRLRATPAAIDELRSAGRWSRIDRVEEIDADGWARVDIRFELFEDAVACLLGLGPSLIVEDPQELRTAIQRRAEQTVAAYRDAERPPARRAIVSVGDRPTGGSGPALCTQRVEETMTRETDQPVASAPPRPDGDSGADKIEAGLADLAALADQLRDLPLDGEEPGVAFDPAWPDEGPR